MGGHYERASVLYDQGNYEGALKEYQLALADDPNCARTHAMIACCYEQLSKAHDALQFAKKAVALDPEYSPQVSIEESQVMVEDAIAVLGKDYTDRIMQAYPERWIDFAQNIGKSTGGFCTSPYGTHPYILMSWANQLSDVYTLIHELGHAFTMRHYGDRRVAIVLYAFGGLAIPSVRRSRTEDIIVSAAGPMGQIAVGLLVYYATRSLDLPSWHIALFLKSFFWISVFWGIFNLVPIVPLDGGHILDGFLGPFRRRITLTVSLACAILVGIWFFQTTHSIFNLMLFGMLAYNNWQELSGRGQFNWMNMR